MLILAFLTFTSCIALSQLSSAKSSSHQPDVVQGKKKCEKYVSYEECVKQATATTAKCRRSNSSHLNVDKICTDLDQKLKKLCSAHSGKASCLECFDKLEEAVERCKNLSEMIHCKNNITVTECEEMKASLTSYCSSKECDVCKDLYCRNGGKCAGPSAVWCTCPAGYTGAFCQKKGKSKCTAKPCKNGGTCIGDNRCKCPPSFYGAQCDRTSRLGTKENPAPNAQGILDAGESQGSGMYWIQPPNETAPAETYCDMSFAGGGWMLASYGYVHTPSGDVSNKDNKAIPNMNNPFGYSWLPNRRSSSNGLINLPHGAVKIANNANYMIMAAGNNPATGGIDQYAFVYRIFLRRNPYKVTFLNHNRYNGGQQGRMHVTKFVVEALKGESGTYVRFALGEALGVTWSDSYPTGYGFSDKNAPFSTFNKGPFFPSVHSGSGSGRTCPGCTPTNFQPDVPGGSPHYTHRGWYTANTFAKTGQTSIWFK